MLLSDGDDVYVGLNRSYLALSMVAPMVVALLLVVLSPTARAHEFRPALLRLEQRADATGSFDLRLIPPKLSTTGPIAAGELTPIVPAHCELRSRSDIAYSLDCGEQGLVGELGVAGLERHPIDVMVEINYADATRYAGVLGPDQPTTAIASNAAAQRGSVFSDYLLLGVEHILIGLDHLLFVLGLVLLVRARDVPTPLAPGVPRGRDPSIRRLLWTVDRVHARAQHHLGGLDPRARAAPERACRSWHRAFNPAARARARARARWA